MFASFFVSGCILFLGALSVGLNWWAGRLGSPLPLIFSRWARWMFMGLAGGYLLSLTDYFNQPLAVLVVVALLIWFLLETIYAWIAVNALSNGDMPLFPVYEISTRTDDWPALPRFIQIREWLRGQGFKKSSSLVAKLNDEIFTRMVLFENEQRTIRLQFLILPSHREMVIECCEVVSTSTTNVRLLTDNLFLPYGGFYPESWQVERTPWTRSIQTLLERHKARMDAIGGEWQQQDEEPLESLRQDTRKLEVLNREMGFLSTQTGDEEGDQGRITPAGKFRLWQEVWTLAYLGMPLRY